MFKKVLYWFVFSSIALVAWFIYLPESLLSDMVLFIWAISGAVVLYNARKKQSRPMAPNERYAALLIGVGIILLSFINNIFGLLGIQETFWNPPYSLGEFSILLTGASILFYTSLGNRNLLLPAAFPAFTEIVYQLYSIYLRSIDVFAESLTGPSAYLSTAVLNLLGIKASLAPDYVIRFLSRAGELVQIRIVSDCSGIWSLSAFAASVLIVSMAFPQMLSKKGLVYLSIGLVGTYASNILRVVAICASAYMYGESGLAESVHLHAGWIAFSGWMLIYWYFVFSRFLLAKPPSGKALSGR